MHMNELKSLNSSLGFDNNIVISCSSTEHDGLGRYGMTAKDDAFLILAIPNVYLFYL